MIINSSAKYSDTITVLAYVYVVVMYATIALNILCDGIFIVVYFRYKTLQQNNFTFYIFHATIADLIGTLGIICIGLVSKKAPAKNKFLCGLYYFLFFISFDVSYLLTFLTALDRYFAVSYPIQHLNIMTTFRMRLSVAFAWIVVFFALLLLNFAFSQWTGTCFVTYFIPKHLFIVFNCFGVALVCVATCVVYVKLAFVMFEKRKKIFSTIQRSTAWQTEMKATLKATVFTLGLALILVIFRLPYIIVSLILYDKETTEGFVAWAYALLLVAVTPLVNFVMYAIQFTEIRYFLSMFFRCCKQVPSTSGNVVLHLTQESNDRRFSRLRNVLSKTATNSNFILH